MTPALRRRRERAEHQRSLIQEQAANNGESSIPADDIYCEFDGVFYPTNNVGIGVTSINNTSLNTSINQ